MEYRNECDICQWDLRAAQDKIVRLEAVIKASILALRGTPHPPDWSQEPTPAYVADVLEQSVK